MDDVVGLSSHERHIERVENDAGLQGGREGPSDDPTRPGVENDREVEKAGQRRQEGVSRPKEFRLRPLAEPDVNLSAHPAPIIQPWEHVPSSNAQTSTEMPTPDGPAHATPLYDAGRDACICA